jgi:hypothetical protein
MANIAFEARPALVGVFLATLVLAPWQHPPRVEVVRVSLDEVKRPPVIVPMELGAGPAPRGVFGVLADALFPAQPGVIEPPAHPDAQPWPRGMVITPPAFPDRMAIDLPSALDKMLSALLVPWHSIAS